MHTRTGLRGQLDLNVFVPARVKAFFRNTCVTKWPSSLKGHYYHRRAFSHICDFFVEMRRRSVAIREI